jgi:hypothetical protein
MGNLILCNGLLAYKKKERKKKFWLIYFYFMLRLMGLAPCLIVIMVI